VEFVGPQVGKELASRTAGSPSLLVVIGIVIYLACRFEWKLRPSRPSSPTCTT
jgi:preprotein translocase subunit SecF